MRFIILFFPLWALANDCDYDLDTVMLHEQRILSVLKSGEKNMQKEVRKDVLDSLACLVEIQIKAEGLTKYVANSFLQTLMGNGQIKGVPLDQRYAQVSDLIYKMGEASKDPAHMLLLEAYSQGEWGLYSLMCEKGSTEYCSDFLPEADRIAKQSPMVAASSMVLLKTAYLKLSGEQQKKIADRIRDLHQNIPKNEKLKRRVIDAIFNEVFNIPVSLLG